MKFLLPNEILMTFKMRVFVVLPCVLIHAISVTLGCVDLYPKLCKDYKNNKVVDTCTYKDIGKWMQANCFKTCNLCHLYTKPPTTTLPPRTIPPMVNCGRSKIQKGHVINGVNAVHGAWPWQVQLRYRGTFLCGGSLVTPYYIVTAAHCVSRRRKIKDFTVALGDHNRNITEPSETVYQVRDYSIHGSYSRPHIGVNDIALLKLAKPVIMTDKIQRVCLPDPMEELPEGSTCFITGWGKMEQRTRKGAVILQQAPLKTVSYEKCKYNEGMRRKVTKSMLCAGNLVDSTSGCHGDSGGPFVCQKSDGRWFLYGVVSWGSPICRTRDGYSVFTKVSHYRSWLDRFIWY